MGKKKSFDLLQYSGTNISVMLFSIIVLFAVAFTMMSVPAFADTGAGGEDRSAIREQKNSEKTVNGSTESGDSEAGLSVQDTEVLYPVYIGATQVTSKIADDVFGDGTVCYESTGDTSGTLTLNGATVTDYIDLYWWTASIHTEGLDLTLVLNGDNQVEDPEDISEYALDICGGNLSIKGDGTLTASSEYSAIYCNADINVSGAELDLTSTYGNGICSYGDVDISDAVVKASAEESYNAAIYSNGDITVDGAKVTAIGGYGLSAQTNIAINNSRNGDYTTRVETELIEDGTGYATGVWGDDPKIEINDDLSIVTPAGGKISELDVGGYSCLVITDSEGNLASHAIIEPEEYLVNKGAVSNGKLSVSAEKAAVGTEITVTASPAYGYINSSVFYTDEYGKKTDITSEGKFTMPKSDVTVNATFRKAKTLITKMTAKGNNKLVLSWSKVKGADGYDVFFARCNNSEKKYKMKKVKSFTGDSKTTWTKSGLKTMTPYKAYVKAYVMVNGSKKYIRKSPTVHVLTSGSTAKYTNPKAVKVKKSSISVKAGKTSRIKASVTKLNNSKQLISTAHAATLRYLSSDTSVAKVTKKGTVKGISAGTCKIYVISTNGASKAVKVTVR